MPQRLRPRIEHSSRVLEAGLQRLHRCAIWVALYPARHMHPLEHRIVGRRAGSAGSSLPLRLKVLAVTAKKIKHIGNIGAVFLAVIYVLACLLWPGIGWSCVCACCFLKKHYCCDCGAADLLSCAL